jgi:hypothetical protein
VEGVFAPLMMSLDLKYIYVHHIYNVVKRENKYLYEPLSKLLMGLDLFGNPTSYYVKPVALFPIKKHYDIKLSYKCPTPILSLN